jgi:hypothetical protein
VFQIRGIPGLFFNFEGHLGHSGLVKLVRKFPALIFNSLFLSYEKIIVIGQTAVYNL